MIKIDTFRKAFFLGQLNNLELDSAVVGNAYLHIFNNKNIYMVAVPEFVEYEVQVLISVRSIYGLKKSMALLHEVLSDNIKLIIFIPSKAYPYL